MRNTLVRFNITRTNRICFFEQPNLERHKSRGFIRNIVCDWMLAVCKRVMKAIGAFWRRWEDEPIYDEVTVETGSIVDRLIRAGMDVQCLVYDRPTHILVGPDILTELRREERQWMQFAATARLSNGRGQIFVAGFNVIFVPWMRGYLPITPQVAESITESGKSDRY